jgi:hypothetical protein
VQLIGQPDQQRILIGPHRCIEPPVGGRFDLSLTQADLRGECDGVDAPLVLGAAAGAGAQDHDLAVARVHAAVTEDSRAEGAHPREQIVVDAEHAEQRQRLERAAGWLHLRSIASISGA